MAAVSVTATFNRRRGRMGCFLLLFALIVGVWVVFPLNVPGIPDIVRGLLLLVPIGMTLLMWPALANTFASGPMLTIGPEGIRYTEFSPQAVPWSDIESVTLTRGYWRNGKGPDATYSAAPSSDSVAYRVRTPSAYPKPRGVVGWALAYGGGYVPINTIVVEASAVSLMAAITPHYRGPIREIPVASNPEPR